MRSELMGAFLDEVEEQLHQLEQDILQLEQEGESEQAIQNIFRTAHTLKGSSATMGFEQMKALTHEMENVLDKIRTHQMGISSEVVDVLFECLDMLGVLKLEIERTGTAHTHTGAIVDKLRLLVDRAVPEAEKGGEAREAADVADVADVTDVDGLRKQDGEPGGEAGGETALEPGWCRVECRVTLALACEMKAARAAVIQESLNQHSRVLETVPKIEEDMLPIDGNEVIYYVETGLRLDELEALLRREIDVEHVVLRCEDRAAPARIPLSGAGEPASPNASGDGTAASDPQGRAVDAHRRTGQTIRVDVERLDNLMNLVGELVIDQTRIAQLSGLLRDVYHADEAFEDLEQISNHIARVISELQESVMKTRMLPIDRLFSRFPRMVRDLAQELGKEIELIVEGKETELDRTVIEEIGDPLIHLIRNSVDHGIESREERLAAGKPAKGTVRLSAMHQENHVVITVEDDGAGISPDRIRASAVAKGLITEAAAAAMSDRDAVQFIFAPGLSTARQVSEVSGRGVGMDIVRTHIEKLNGLIDVETRPGAGTKFTIQLPLTLAIVSGLLIKLGHLTYALPMSSVVEIVRIPNSDITYVKGRPMVQIREQVMPLAWLHDHFRIPRTRHARRNVFVVVVGVAEKRLGLVVDELMGNQEIVVKSIGSYVGKVDGVSGATILGDGSVALILDVVGLMKLALHEDGAVIEEARALANG